MLCGTWPYASDLGPLFLLPSPYRGSTVGRREASFGNICGPPTKGRQAFSYDLGPGEEISIGYSTVSEWGLGSVGGLRYGGAFPGDSHVGCLNYNSNFPEREDTLIYQNLGTSAVAVYFGVGYSGAANQIEEGDFVLVTV